MLKVGFLEFTINLATLIQTLCAKRSIKVESTMVINSQYKCTTSALVVGHNSYALGNYLNVWGVRVMTQIWVEYSKVPRMV